RRRHGRRVPGGRYTPGTPSRVEAADRKSTRLNSSHVAISYAVFCLKKKKSPVGMTRRKSSVGMTQQKSSRLFHALSSSRFLLGRFFFNDTATTEIYTLSLHDALPILELKALALKGAGSTKRSLEVYQQLYRSEEHTSELQSRPHLVCRLLLEKN